MTSVNKPVFRLGQVLRFPDSVPFRCVTHDETSIVASEIDLSVDVRESNKYNLVI